MSTCDKRSGSASRTPADSADQQVLLVGENNLQDSMLVGLIRRQVNVPCQMATHNDWLGRLVTKATVGRQPTREYLILVDVSRLDAMQLDDMLMELAALPSHCGEVQLAMLNVQPQSWPEDRVRWFPVTGLFYQGCTHRHLIRGLRALLEHQHWLPRHLTQRFWEELRSSIQSTTQVLTQLTPRELETLQLMKSGGSNQEIAACLNLSVHTVKTYLYSIYTKLNVRNRTEASIWARRHL